jgi:LacI family transcriptional regulator, xylobiose transport system transcriptional regulator
VSGGRERARELLGRDDRPTAIFAGSDMQALGVMEAARERGIRVPEELSIVGYDDIPLARWLTPRLTTVHQPLRRMGEEAARLAIRLADDLDHEQGATDAGSDASGSAPTPRMDLATSLVVRESTAPPVASPA